MIFSTDDRRVRDATEEAVGGVRAAYQDPDAGAVVAWEHLPEEEFVSRAMAVSANAKSRFQPGSVAQPRTHRHNPVRVSLSRADGALDHFRICRLSHVSKPSGKLLCVHMITKPGKKDRKEIALASS